MSGKTGIQWTDVTWNPSVGCTRVSAGCDFCYAFQLHDQRHIAWKRGRWPDAPEQYRKPFSKVQLLPQRLTDPLSWRAPQKVFVDSMADLFHPDVPDTFIQQVWAMMALTPQHTYQILTKRPERMRDWVRAADQTALKVAGMQALGGLPWRQRDRLQAKLARVWEWPLPNIWLGVSVEDQRAADERIPLLLQTPAAVRFLSCEPLIGPVDLSHLLFHPCADGCKCRWPDDPDARECACGGECQTADDWGAHPGIDWVIIGGESGRHARVMHPDWAESLVAQCRAAGIAPFMKQLGSELAYLYSLKDRHGGDMVAWPPDFDPMRVREFPQAAHAEREEG